MPVDATTLKGQYATQVAADLERNEQEQERIKGEVESLQAQLTALQDDHGLLLSMQNALGGERPTTPTPVIKPTAEAAAVKSAAVPRSRRSMSSSTDTGKGKVKKARTPAAASSGTKAAKSNKPTLRDMVTRHLAGQNEPRSVAEVTFELQAAHTDRTVKATVVRNTLENLVARGDAERSKQGGSVYYTATTAKPSDQTSAEPAPAKA